MRRTALILAGWLVLLFAVTPHRGEAVASSGLPTTRPDQAATRPETWRTADDVEAAARWWFDRAEREGAAGRHRRRLALDRPPSGARDRKEQRRRAEGDRQRAGAARRGRPCPRSGRPDQGCRRSEGSRVLHRGSLEVRRRDDAAGDLRP